MKFDLNNCACTQNVLVPKMLDFRLKKIEPNCN